MLRWEKACRKAQRHLEGTRGFAVVAWGKNNYGQCGVPSHAPALLGPQEVTGLTNPIQALVAGSNHSAAITTSGELFTFGCGAFGKLGLGRTDPAFLPDRVESLVGRVQIVDAALGQHHSLFLDNTGAIHACGVSSDGGFDAIALQMEAETGNLARSGAIKGALAAANRMFPGNSGGGSQSSSSMPWRSGSFGGHGGGGGLASSAREARATAAAAALAPPSASGFVASTDLLPFIDYKERRSELGYAKSLYDDSIRGLVLKNSAGRHYEASATTGLLGSHDAAGHHFSIPVRLGSAVAMLRTHEQSMLSLAACGATGGSIALSSSGQPLLLKVPRRWAESHKELIDRRASLLLPTPPCPLLTRVLQNGGGAVQVAAGAGYFAALMSNQKVVLWLNHSVSAATGSPVAQEREESHGDVTLRALGNTLLAEFPQLPAITSIAAGHTTLHMTDGQSVWSVKVHSNSPASSANKESTFTKNTTTAPTTTKEKGTPSSSSSLSSEVANAAAAAAAGSGETQKVPLQPKRVLRLTDEGITSITAGGDAAAVVTDAGRLWLWGDVVTEEQVNAVGKKAEGEGFGHWSYSGSGSGVSGSERWPGLGSPYPVVIPGLHKVKQIALGASHALVEVA